MQPALLTSDLDPGAVPPVLGVLAAATERLWAGVAGLSEEEIHAPSLLEGWSRLTVLAHLRAGAEATLRLTDDALAGRAAAFYPGGAPEREASLLLRPGESPSVLITDLFAASERLARRWRELTDLEWAVELREAKLGWMRLTRLVALRLTEVEVHSVDLALDGLTHWSDPFVEISLPLRVAWLPAHARSLPHADRSINGRWLLRTTTGTTWLVSASGGLSSAGLKVGITEDSVDCVIEGTERELLGLLLGRVPVEALRLSGDQTLARSFKAAFPGP